MKRFACFSEPQAYTSYQIKIEYSLAWVSKLLVSLGHTGRRVVWSHTLNTQTLTKTGGQKQVLSTFLILCWAAFTAILGHMWPAGHGLGVPASKAKTLPKFRAKRIPFIMTRQRKRLIFQCRF